VDEHATLSLSGDLVADPSGRTVSECLHLVLLWARQEPERVGECASVKRSLILGRGVERLPDDPPHVEWVRSRPGANEPTGALSTPTLSRRQWRLVPTNDAIDVENLGRRQLFHNGVQVQSCRARAGDTLGVGGVALFLVAKRPALLPQFPHKSFDFGGADPDGIVGETPEIWQVRQDLARLAAQSAHALVLGESGSGKELCVRALHARSTRASGPFVARNAATIPASLVEAELFGQAANYPNSGAGARQGLAGLADGGTLFLDEIGEMGELQQANLLRLLDAGQYQRLGEDKLRTSDLRVLAATNRQPGTLKPDLLARFPERLLLPSLNARRADVPLLVRSIIQRLLEQRAITELPQLGMELIDTLTRHEYTLHFRELERLVRLCAQTRAGELWTVNKALASELKLRPTQAELDISQVRLAIEASKNASEAAERLGLANRYALYRLMKQLGLERTP